MRILIIAALVWTVNWIHYADTYVDEQGRAPERPVTIGVFQVFPDTTVLVGEQPDPPEYTHEVEIPHGRRYYFMLRARWTQGSSWSPPSLLVSGASVMLTTTGLEPYTETHSQRGRDALKVRLPAGVPFLASWSEARPVGTTLPGYSEAFWAWCVWDHNRDGTINLSDFSVFGEAEPSPEEVEAFTRIYGRPAFYFVNIQGGRP